MWRFISGVVVAMLCGLLSYLFAWLVFSDWPILHLLLTTLPGIGFGFWLGHHEPAEFWGDFAGHSLGEVIFRILFGWLH